MGLVAKHQTPYVAPAEDLRYRPNTLCFTMFSDKRKSATMVVTKPNEPNRPNETSRMDQGLEASAGGYVHHLLARRLLGWRS